ncbi:hypothetical protein ACWCQN_47615 [Streptomyces sp. NPDC001984]
MATDISADTASERAGEADDPAMDAELEQVTSTPGAGGMLLVPQRELDACALPRPLPIWQVGDHKHRTLREGRS